jgi:hypothetical protein
MELDVELIFELLDLLWQLKLQSDLALSAVRGYNVAAVEDSSIWWKRRQTLKQLHRSNNRTHLRKAV